MSDENDVVAEENNSALSKAVNIVSGVLRSPAAELDALREDGSDDALREMVREYGSTFYTDEVLDALKENGSDVAMSLIPSIINRAVEAVVCDADVKTSDFMIDRALDILKDNGSEAAMRSVFAIMENSKDDTLIPLCEKIIEDNGDEAMNIKLQVLLDGELPETAEDDHSFDDILPS